jgi:hypothetical protein
MVDRITVLRLRSIAQHKIERQELRNKLLKETDPDKSVIFKFHIAALSTQIRRLKYLINKTESIKAG